MTSSTSNPSLALTGNDTKRGVKADISKTMQNRRSASRLAAVQALYQVELGGGAQSEVFKNFLEIYQGAPLSSPESATADGEFFSVLVQGVSDEFEAVDRMLDKVLQNQKVERLDTILRAVLRLGAFELMSQKEIPARVIITEYLNLAHAFFVGSEAKLVNGVLDHIAQILRADEFK